LSVREGRCLNGNLEQHKKQAGHYKERVRGRGLREGAAGKKKTARRMAETWANRKRGWKGASIRMNDVSSPTDRYSNPGKGERTHNAEVRIGGQNRKLLLGNRISTLREEHRWGFTGAWEKSGRKNSPKEEKSKGKSNHKKKAARYPCLSSGMGGGKSGQGGEGESLVIPLQNPISKIHRGTHERCEK